MPDKEIFDIQHNRPAWEDLKLEQAGINLGFNITQHYIDPQKEGRFTNETGLITKLHSLPTTTKMISLDWENPLYGLLDSRDESVIEDMNRAAQIAKEIHPQAHVGFYGIIPVRRYWNRDEDWEGDTQWISERITEVTCWLPSVYLLYYPIAFKHLAHVQGDANETRIKRYIIANIEMAKRFSNNKPVYPVVMHRFPSSSKDYTNYFCTDAIWRWYCDLVIGHSDGLVWWSNDHAMTQEKFELVYQKEYPSQTWDDVYEDIHTNYIDILTGVRNYYEDKGFIGRARAALASCRCSARRIFNASHRAR
jgi:hypothetical protein